MSIRRIWNSLFPSPRRPIGWRAAIPLVAFLVVFTALCVWLEWADKLLFARPWAFVLMAFSVWVWWLAVAGYGGLTRGRGLAALLIRLSLLGVFVMLLAEPRAVRVVDVISVVYALDVSDSVYGDTGSNQGRMIDEALNFVNRTVSEKPGRDQAGLIVFGRNSGVELPPRNSFPFEAINSRIDRDATNLEQALSLSAAMLPEENRGRIVLITDGTATEGNYSQVLDQLSSRGISVDVLPIQYAYDKEVWIERLELPQFVKIGENYEANVVLSSLEAGEGELVLRERGEIVAQRHVEYQPGKNRFVLPIQLSEPGYYEYSATIEVRRSEDNLERNNTALNYIFVEGEGRVLVVSDPQGDARDTDNLVQAIREGQRAVDVAPAYDFPRDSLSLMPYDSIVFVNVPADALDAVQMQAVKDSVRNLGIGFLMVGGANSFGPGGYHRTVIEEALPVSMDITKKKVLPKGALVIILHTCEFPEGNTWGKRITKQAIKVLGDQDEVGVLAFDGANGESWVFELTSAGDYEKLVPKINAAQIGDMPSFTNTMRMGLEGLKKSDAAAKHMIIISDGDPSPPPPPLVSEFKENNISVSMVAIFPHGGAEISMMRVIASVTGGRYYFPADPSLLPSIFIKESKTLKRSMIQNKTVTPEIGFDTGILKGIDAIPPLHGYVLTTVKNNAMSILRVPPKENEEDDIDPILARWRYGLGTTAAFTSDLSTNWGKDWVNWDKYRPFVKQLMTDISRVRKQSNLRMWTYTTGNEGTIIVEDYDPEEAFLDVHAQISGPRERSETVALKQVGPRRYQATVPLWGKGRYQVAGVGVAGDRTDRAQGGFIVPYSPEYLRFRSNPVVLEEIASRTGGRRLDANATADTIYGRRDPKQSSSPIFDKFLILLACLIPLDVAIRRVQLDWYVIKSWLGLDRKSGPTTQTMSTLLERKQAVHSQLTRERTESATREKTTVGQLVGRKPAERPSRAEQRESSEHQAAAEQRGGSQETPESLSTTERLLEMKRRRQQDQE